MLGAMATSGDSGLQDAILRSLLAEFGDKTFFLTVAFSAWCPWKGVRKGWSALVERCFVFVSTYGALVVRILMFNLLGDPSLWWGTVLSSCTCLACVVMAAIAYKHHKALDNAQGKALIEFNKHFGPADPRGIETGTTWNDVAFPRVPLASSSETYGSLLKSETSHVTEMPAKETPAKETGATDTAARGPLSQIIRNMSTSSFLATLLSFICTFCAEADDKRQSTTNMIRQSPTLFLIGSVIGLIPAVFAAVLLGYAMTCSFTDDKVVFAVMSINVCLFIVTASQFLMHTTIFEHAATSLFHVNAMLMPGLADGR